MVASPLSSLSRCRDFPMVGDEGEATQMGYVDDPDLMEPDWCVCLWPRRTDICDEFQEEHIDSPYCRVCSHVRGCHPDSLNREINS